jgi:hypothetical protein
MVQSGSAWHGILNSGEVTYMSGADTSVRAVFIANGNLSNTQDMNYRVVSNSWPVFGLAKTIGTTADSTACVRDCRISCIASWLMPLLGIPLSSQLVTHDRLSFRT